jgi:hypothetical protein
LFTVARSEAVGHCDAGIIGAEPVALLAAVAEEPGDGECVPPVPADEAGTACEPQAATSAATSAPAQPAAAPRVTVRVRAGREARGAGREAGRVARD